MNTSAAIAIAFLAMCTLLIVTYVYLVRPVLLDILRFEVFAQRDLLRRLAIENKVKCTSPGYRILEQRINGAVQILPFLTVHKLVKLTKLKPTPEQIERISSFDRSATDELKAIDKRVFVYFMSSLIINSPASVFCTVMVILLFKFKWPRIQLNWTWLEKQQASRAVFQPLSNNRAPLYGGILGFA